MNWRPSKPFRVFAALVATAAVGYLGFRMTLRHLIERELATLIDEGEPISLHQLNTRYRAPDSAEDNAAPLYQQAYANLTVGDGTGLSTAPFGQALQADPAAPLPEATIQALDLLVQREAWRMALCEQAAARPGCRFPIDYRRELHGPGDVSRFVGMAFCARLVQARLLLHAESGRTTEALADFHTAVQMARGVGMEPTYGAYAVRRNMLDTLALAVGRLIHRCELSPASLQHLAADFAALAAETNLDGCLAGEFCLGTAQFTAPLNREHLIGADGGAALPLFTLPGYGDGLDLALLRYLRSFSELRGMVRDGDPAALPTSIGSGVADSRLPPSAQLKVMHAELIASLNVTRLGLLLEAYRQRHNALPESLATLTEDGRELLDPCAHPSASYRYQCGTREVRIYSVARDGFDDGGSETYYVQGLAGFRGGDVAFCRRLPQEP